MTKKELEKMFTFPSGIDELYRPKQDAVENVLYQLYEASGFALPKIYFFKSPLALQEAINYLPQEGRAGREMSPGFVKEYPAFANGIFYGKFRSEDIHHIFWRFISNSVAGRVAQRVDNEQELLPHFNRFFGICTSMEKALGEDLKSRMSLKGMNLKAVARHPHFRDVIWLQAHRHHLDKLAPREKDLLLLYYDLIKNGLLHAFLTEDSVLWCPLPTHFKVNVYKQFHCEDGAALQWNDGYGLYFWNGIKVRKRLIEFPESITRLDIMEEADEEIRRCMREKLGARRFAALFDLVVVDTDRDPDGKKQLLLRTRHVDDLAREHIYFAQLTHPSTEREHFLFVPPGMNNVWDAAAWTFGEKKDSNPREDIKI